MCHDWWDEGLHEERLRLAKDEADKLKQLTERFILPQSPKPEQKPERNRQTQPDAVPV